jgi:hypothetical protein
MKKHIQLRDAISPILHVNTLIADLNLSSELALNPRAPQYEEIKPKLMKAIELRRQLKVSEEIEYLHNIDAERLISDVFRINGSTRINLDMVLDQLEFPRGSERDRCLKFLWLPLKNPRMKLLLVSLLLSSLVNSMSWLLHILCCGCLQPTNSICEKVRQNA